MALQWKEMRLLIPIAIVVIIVVGVFAFLKIGRGVMNPESVNQSTANVASQKVPVTGNPDDVAAAVDKAAVDEQNAIGAEDEDSASVTADDPEIGAIGESVNENEF